MNKEAYLKGFEEEMEKMGLRAVTSRRALIKRLWQLGSGAERRSFYRHLTTPGGVLTALKRLGRKPLSPSTLYKINAGAVMKSHRHALDWLGYLK